jgi:methyl-accepting chemotaxis protein
MMKTYALMPIKSSGMPGFKKGLISETRVRWSIRWKLMTTITVLMLSLLILLTVFQISSQKRLMERELEKRIALMKENLIERGKNFTANMTQQVEQDIAGFNFSGLMENIRQNVQKNREARYAILTDADGMAYVHTLKPDLARTRLDSPRDQEALAKTEMTVREYADGGERVIEVISPIQISTTPWGVLRVIFTQKLLETEIQNSRRQIQKEGKRMINKAIYSSLAIMMVSFLIALFLSTKFSTPLIHLTQSARRLSKGDFTRTVQIRGKDEIGVLAESMNHMVFNLNEIISKNVVTSQHLLEASFDQTTSLDETTLLLKEMADMTRNNADSANRADEFMLETNQVVQRANESMTRLTASMEEITAASEETFQIIKNIDEIAFQTNILALNAAVEAARAGEAGVSFAVVAAEVRNLALRSAKSARDTADMIEATVQKIKDGAHLVHSANEGFKEVSENAARVAELVSDISDSSTEQKKRIEQINEAVERMNERVRQNSASAQELAASMSVFKVSDS